MDMAKKKAVPKGMSSMTEATVNPLMEKGRKKAVKGKGTVPAFLKKKKK
jgi:hypothetical protein